MTELTEYIFVCVTTSSLQEAELIAKAVVEKRLAACGNIIPNIRSVFWWNGSIEAEQEALLILKSRRSLFSELSAAVKTLHSYEVPEVIALPLIAGSQEYLHWIEQETLPDKR